MKTILLNRFQNSVLRSLIAIIACICSFTVTAQIAPSLSFKNPTLVSGTALKQGAVYKFPAVFAGVDAFITIDSLLNGATVTEIDQTGGVGYDDAFQPIVSTVSGSPDCLARFLIEFKTSIGSAYTFPYLASTGLDIDGTTLDLVEFCKIDMKGGAAIFQSNQTEISISKVGTGFKALNITGNNVSGIDSTYKEVMFTVCNSNVSTMTIDFGSVRTSGNGVRNYAAFFRDYDYPAEKALPVKLVSFSAMLSEDNLVSLNWVTSTEDNLSHFVVERSFDGKEYEEAGLVFANGNSSAILNYSFFDNNTGYHLVIYYRLRSVDIDGKYEYSSTRIIRNTKQKENELTILIYPNPVSNELRITNPVSWQNKPVVYELFSANGTVANKTMTGNSSQTETINVSNLVPGFYILRAICNNEMAQQKIIKH